MATYRLYWLDGMAPHSSSSGRASSPIKVASAEWIDADSDDEALQAADALRAGRTCELWQKGRLVARLGATA